MKAILIFFVFLISSLNFAQGFTLATSHKTKIKFKFLNNLILIPVNVNGVELTFLLDSGVSETILFSLENKTVNFEKMTKTIFKGLGSTTQVDGWESAGNTLKIGSNYIDKYHMIYLILNEEFNFSDHVGIPVNGIIGYNFFKNYPLKIDYQRKEIIIYPDQQSFDKEKSKKYEEHPITLELNKPYLWVDVEQTTEYVNSKVLIDIGNSDAVWLFPTLIPNFKYNRPNIEDFLGRGFNGDIFGKRSRIHHVKIGKYVLEKPIVAMPDEYSVQHLQLVPQRKGSIGNETLRRFSVLFNYPEKKVYFKPFASLSDPFHINMSGLDIKHNGTIWSKELVQVANEVKTEQESRAYPTYRSSETKFQYKFSLVPNYIVAGARSDSPAYEAGIRKGDQLISINGSAVSRMTLQRINQFFKSQEGRSIQITIDRDGKQMEFKFKLQDPIPYDDEE